MNGTTIWPIHHSMRTRLGRPRPHNMDSIDVSPEAKAKLVNEALEIFADCVNAGMPFQDALATIYFSGVAFAIGASGDTALEESE